MVQLSPDWAPRAQHPTRTTDHQTAALAADLAYALARLSGADDAAAETASTIALASALLTPGRSARATLAAALTDGLRHHLADLDACRPHRAAALHAALGRLCGPTP